MIVKCTNIHVNKAEYKKTPQCNMINFHLAGLQFKVLCMLESTSPFDQYSFISDISFSVLPCLKHMATCTHMYMYMVFKLFEKKNLYKNLPCFLHSLDFLFSKLEVLHFLLGWCCLLVAYFNRMVKPVDQNQLIQIKTILLNTENS